MNDLSQVKIILVRTSHPGNIGASARAMKTMGFSNLHLVAPEQFPDSKAEEMASGADDLLQSAIVHADLQSAISDCHWVVGTSTRIRSIPWAVLTPRQMAERSFPLSTNQKMALVFGCERSGLSNDELEYCQSIVSIPTSEEYGALNLAAAVQVLCYEMRMMWLAKKNTQTVLEKDADYSSATLDFAPASEIEAFFAHLRKVMIQVQFLKPQAPRRLMTRMRRLFLRAHLERMEVNMLRGFLAAIEKSPARIKK